MRKNSFNYQVYKAFAEKYRFTPLGFIAWGTLNKRQLASHISKIIASADK